MIIWIIGLSGSGKTTLGKILYDCLKEKNIQNLIHIDGDSIRKIYDQELGHDLKSRETNSRRISNLCHFLDNENIIVICSVLSIFPDHREELKIKTKKYFEIYLDVDISYLEKYRDYKGIYKSFNEGKLINVVGKDIKFIAPLNYDLKIKNDSMDKANLFKNLPQILELINL